jgi:hypothetical protein
MTFTRCALGWETPGCRRTLATGRATHLWVWPQSISLRPHPAGSRLDTGGTPVPLKK